jgi:hypothetical protein
MDKGRAAYEGYAAYTGGKTFDGRDMPTWQELPPRIRNAWGAAIVAAERHDLQVRIDDLIERQRVGLFPYDGSGLPEKSPPKVRQVGEERCNTCGCLWRKWSDGTMGMAPGEKCGPCCDNVPLNVPPVDRSAREVIGAAIAPGIADTTDRGDGQQRGYVVLSEEERRKGYKRPVRRSYLHAKCGSVTTMGEALAETYARDPAFYSGTFCANCEKHFPVGPEGEFTWADTTIKVGT